MFRASAYLIAQFGKNYAVGNGMSIRGTELMECTMSVLHDAQEMVGGGLYIRDGYPSDLTGLCLNQCSDEIIGSSGLCPDTAARVTGSLGDYESHFSEEK